jgi:DNA-binding FadR family transcriptional regulator
LAVAIEAMQKPNRNQPQDSGAESADSANGPTRPLPTVSGWNTAIKMAEKLASTLESEIMAKGWPVGEPLGSEPELIERFGVSRAVFREAVRIVEHHGAARMRRGPGGGLIVTAPHPQAAVLPVTLYLDYTDVSAQDLFDVRNSLELACARICAEQIDEAGVRRLRDVLEREREQGAAGAIQGHTHELHIAIAAITGNAAMQLFVEILARLTFERTGHLHYEPSELEGVYDAHAAIVDAIVAGDSSLAQHRVSRHLAALTQYYHRRNGDAGQ